MQSWDEGQEPKLPYREPSAARPVVPRLSMAFYVKYYCLQSLVRLADLPRTLEQISNQVLDKLAGGIRRVSTSLLGAGQAGGQLIMYPAPWVGHAYQAAFAVCTVVFIRNMRLALQRA